jgi:putative FmdB family regulatory protein
MVHAASNAPVLTQENVAVPTYEYVCTNCKNRFDTFQRFSEPALTTCEKCGGELRRVFHPASIQFKGSGFYSTDNRRPGGSVKSKTGDKSEGGSGESSGKSSEKSSESSGGSGESKRSSDRSSGDRSSGDRSSGGSGESKRSSDRSSGSSSTTKTAEKSA